MSDKIPTPPSSWPAAGDNVLSRDNLRETEAVWSRRLEKMERECERLEKRLRLGSFALVLLFGVTVLLAFLAAPRAAGVEDSLHARQFVLHDATGLVRGLLEMEDGAGPRMILRDGDGRERVRLNLLADGSPGVTLGDRDGRPRVVLAVLPDGTTNLVFADAVGTTRAILGHSSVDASTLMLADREGTMRAGLVVDAGGDAALTLYEDERPSEPAQSTPGL